MVADQDVALAAASEHREGVGEDAGEGLEVPGQSRPEKERGVGGAADVQLVLEKVLQRDASQNLGLRQGGGQHSGDDDDRRVLESLAGAGLRLGGGRRSHGRLESYRPVHRLVQPAFTRLAASRTVHAAGWPKTKN